MEMFFAATANCLRLPSCNNDCVTNNSGSKHIKLSQVVGMRYIRAKKVKQERNVKSQQWKIAVTGFGQDGEFEKVLLANKDETC